MNLVLLYCVMTVVTAYAPAAGGINCWGDCTTTASGHRPGWTIAGCGPGWETGARLWVPGYGEIRCLDRFGRPPADYAVDLWFPDREQALAWGWREDYPVCRIAEPQPPGPDFVRYGRRE